VWPRAATREKGYNDLKRYCDEAWEGWERFPWRRESEKIGCSLWTTGPKVTARAFWRLGRHSIASSSPPACEHAADSDSPFS
jgi:hypothetical protein